MKQHNRGSALPKVIFLTLLLTVLGITLQYRLGIPGTTFVDRLHARAVTTDLDLLNENDSQANIRATYHYLRHTCTSEASILGDSVCWAPISKFNGIDARLIAFYFRNDKLSAVRISVAPEDHPELVSSLNRRYGSTRKFGRNAGIYGNNIVGWIRPSGLVAINDRIEGEKEAILLWLSPSKVLMRAFGIRV